MSRVPIIPKEDYAKIAGEFLRANPKFDMSNPNHEVWIYVRWLLEKTLDQQIEILALKTLVAAQAETIKAVIR